MDLLGNPEQSYPIIHVTGTNGKGSTMLYEGVIYGTWQKSCDLHLPSYCLYQYRICINGQPIADADFIRLAEQVKEMEKTLLQIHDQFVLFLNC